ncbi:MAG TPA: sulfurtransferase [Propionicimonas sp.]|nr:sulfurtransferase [Propionicimonas sp.]
MSSRSEVLITVDELPDALSAGAQLLDVRWRLGEEAGAGRAEYRKGRLPGARFLDLESVLTGPLIDPTQGRHPLPDADRLAAGLGSLGIDPTRPIIVYDEPGSFAAGRAWWVLRWAGLDARVLDGGIKAWMAEGGDLVSGEAPPVEPTELQLSTGHLPTLDAGDVALFNGVLVDVRAPERFRGEVEPIDPKAGHIPGATNRPVGALWTTDGRLPSHDELRSYFDLDTAKPVAVYCGSGVSAAQAVLALASLGIDAALYPPSWSGWSADPDRPVAVGG